MKRVERWGLEKGNYLRSMYRVKKFLGKFHGRAPTPEDVSVISGDLETIFEKFVKIRSLYPACNRLDLSDEMWGLLHLAGVASREISMLKNAGGSF